MLICSVVAIKILSDKFIKNLTNVSQWDMMGYNGI
jgi:hypothetical protein